MTQKAQKMTRTHKMTQDTTLDPTDTATKPSGVCGGLLTITPRWRTPTRCTSTTRRHASTPAIRCRTPIRNHFRLSHIHSRLSQTRHFPIPNPLDLSATYAWTRLPLHQGHAQTIQTYPAARRSRRRTYAQNAYVHTIRAPSSARQPSARQRECQKCVPHPSAAA
jgi:hypothetical protein